MKYKNNLLSLSKPNQEDMLVVIDKIVNDHIKDDKTGKPVKDPTTGKMIEQGWKVVQEVINVSLIKSSREWHRGKTGDKYTGYIDGSITALCMKEENSNRTPTNIYISEDFKSWIKRTGAIDVER